MCTANSFTAPGMPKITYSVFDAERKVSPLESPTVVLASPLLTSCGLHLYPAFAPTARTGRRPAADGGCTTTTNRLASRSIVGRSVSLALRRCAKGLK